MTALPRGLARTLILSFSVITLILISFIFREQNYQSAANRSLAFPHPKTPGRSRKKFSSTTQSLNLDEEECKTAFPGLTHDIDANIKKGPFEFRKSNPDYKGLVQGRTIDGKVRNRFQDAC